MSCIMTVLTVMSIFNGSQRNDVEVSTNSKVLMNKNEQVSSKVEMLAENLMKTETVTIKCGEDIYSATASVLTVE